MTSITGFDQEDVYFVLIITITSRLLNMNVDAREEIVAGTKAPHAVVSKSLFEITHDCIVLSMLMSMSISMLFNQGAQHW